MASDVLCTPFVPNETHEHVAGRSDVSVAEGAQLVAALECRIGRAHFAIPTEAIERLIEYRTCALPLAKVWVGGIGLHDGRPLISVALHRVKDSPQSETAIKGILLKVPTSPICWALEVNEVFLFVQVRLAERREPRDAKLPPWINIALTPDRRSLALVDVAAMLADVADVAGTGPLQ